MQRVAFALLLAVLLSCPMTGLRAQGCAACGVVALGGSGWTGAGQAASGLGEGKLGLMAVPQLLLLLYFRRRIAGLLTEPEASARG